MRTRYALLAILLLAALTFAPYLGDYFWLDDVAWIDGPRQAGSLFAWIFVPNGLYPFRPLSAALFALLSPLCGCTPWSYRLIGLGLHLANVVLVFRLARRLSGDEGSALAATALWSIYPVHRWAVLWIADLAGLLGASLVLVCLLAYDHYLSEREQAGGGRATPWYALALASYVLAALAKETYIVAALVLPLWTLARLPNFSRWIRDLKSVWHDALAPASPFLLSGLALLVPVGISYALRPGDTTAAYDLVSWRLPANLARAMLYLMVPVINPNAINALPLDNRAVTLAATPLVLGWLALLWRARSPRAWLLSLWAPVLLLPVALSIFVLLPFNGRYMYLPAVGYCVLVAMVFRWVTQRWPRYSGAARQAPAFILAMLAIALALFNTQQQWWVRNPQHPGTLLYSIVWGGVFGCPLAPDEIRAELARAGIASVQDALTTPLLAPEHRYYAASLITRGLARELAGDFGGARADYLAARAVALRGDLDARDKNSGYLIPQARLLAFVDEQLARVAPPGVR